MFEGWNEYRNLFTERLCLRGPKYSDAYDIFSLCSEPEACRYADWYPHKSINESLGYIAWLKRKKKSNTGYTWFAEHKTTGKVIATISVVETDSSGLIATIGYTLSSKFQHMGYATEAVNALIKYLFDEGAKRIQAKVMPQNIPSVKLLERVGMKREALIKCGAYCKTDCVDIYLYGITAEEYNKVTKANEI